MARSTHQQQSLELDRLTDSAKTGDRVSADSADCVALAAVAVPVPNIGALTYAVPTSLSTAPKPGMRCRVPLGKRSLEGVILELDVAPPGGVEVRAIEEIVDHQPVLSEDLLALGRFINEYYLAPVGEVFKAMLPAGLVAWGKERLRITDAGALATADGPLAEGVLDQLRDGRVAAVKDLATDASLDQLWPVVNDLLERGWVRSQGRSRDRGKRFSQAFELAAGEREELLERCGRSKPGQRVVEHLFGLGRAAGREELLEAADCGVGVLRRLVGLDVLREFVEVRSLELDRHRLAGRPDDGGWQLTDEQQLAVQAIGDDISAGSGGRFLLHGVTGSGKTEVYLRAAERAVAEGGTALILVPEIALVPALASQVRDRFGERHAILHSGLSRQERVQEWQRIRSRAAQVVVGPRSALFAPLADLRLLVVDEEHDASYKQETSPRYQGRDTAYMRAQTAGATLVLGSATPSMESRLNVERERLLRLTIENRVGKAQLPEGVVVDLRQEQRPRRPGEIVFSRALTGELQQCLDRGQQAILLRNRRGYAPVLLCSACGHDHACAECGLAQTMHRKDQRLQCHYCGSSRAVPDHCAECGSSELDAVGAGTERVEEQVRELFPNARVEILDRDTARGGGLREILERFGSGDRDILVGTQMVAKGHHFPNVSVAAVLNADTYLSFPDFRGVERAYSLLAQLAGRAGRGETPGKVLIQTRQPDHYAVQAALTADDALFARREMEFRRQYGYPPFTRLIEIVTEDRNRGRARDTGAAIAERLRAATGPAEVRIHGPQAPPHERLAGRWRFQVLVSGRDSRLLRERVRTALPTSSGCRVIVDVDPCQLF